MFAVELSHLQQADKQIAQAHEFIARVSQNAEAGDRAANSTQTAGQSLATLKENLVEFEAHRALFVQTIADIRAGTLPST